MNEIKCPVCNEKYSKVKYFFEIKAPTCAKCGNKFNFSVKVRILSVLIWVALTVVTVLAYKLIYNGHLALTNIVLVGMLYAILLRFYQIKTKPIVYRENERINKLLKVIIIILICIAALMLVIVALKYNKLYSYIHSK